MPKERKWGYVRASRYEQKKLATWIFEVLDSAAKKAQQIHDGEIHPPRAPWSDADDLLLGKSDDVETANKLGRTRGSVRARRIKLGIPAFRLPGRAVGEGKPWAEHKKGKRKPKP